MNTQVNHPAHYNTPVPAASRPALKALSQLSDEDMDRMECIAAMAKLFGPTAAFWFCVLSAFKYLWRAGHKGDAFEDYAKAYWYCQYAAGLEGARVTDRMKLRIKLTITELELLGVKR